MTVKKLRPFHETIVETIKTANSSQLETIAVLLETTIIPKDHTQIVTAWLDRCIGFRFDPKRATKVALLIIEQGQNSITEK